MAAVNNAFIATGHKQTITLNWKSILKKCEDFSGPVNGFVFVDFNSIIEQTCPRDSFFDVIGQIVSFRALETSNPNPSKHYIKMTISNLQSVHLKVTIFGTQAYQMSHNDFKGDFPLKIVCEITKPLKVMKFLLVGFICKDLRCNNSDFHTVTKYIIPINIQDDTGTIGLTLFDREAKRLLDISAYDLKKIHEASIQSVSLNQVPLESDDVVQNVQKDLISQMDEIFTPSTVDKSTATSPIKISTDLKRNLHDIYDVDCGDDLSSKSLKENQSERKIHF
ncbi:unnamed protein product [Lactuca virosa]|uniref:Replication factor A C-terminal domain-containing protein n=1 Tax=Lactuca virosa TaxID=75947 RepID=A0AAU9M3H3_9ASTR|nr:unnamed protein product [Lactuca virosa]